MGPANRACIALALLASGCASVAPQPISPEASARALDARTLADPRLLKFVDASLALTHSPPRDGRWDLGTLTLAALYYHPNLDIARAELAAAQAGAKAAAQRPNPTATLGLSYNGTTAVPSPWTVGLMVDFIVETFGKRGYRRAEAGHLVDAARADLASAAWAVRSGLREALLDHWLARQRVELARAGLAQRKSLLRLVERRYALGEDSAPEVTRERVALDRATLALGEAERGAARTRAALARAVGVPLRALEGVPLSFAELEAPPAVPAARELAQLRGRALTSRSDVQALLAEYAAAQSALQRQVASRFPDVHLGPGVQYDQGDHKYRLDVSAALPVFGQNEGAIARAEARRDAVGARFTALQAGIIAEVDAAADDCRLAARALAAGDRLVADARRRAEAMRRRFEAGAANRPELLRAQVELSAAELARLDALGAERRAVGALEDGLHAPLLGEGPLPPPGENSPRLAEEKER